MRKLSLILILCLLSTVAFASSVSLKWNASTTPGVEYRIYRAPCTGTVANGVCSEPGRFDPIFTTTETTYDDTKVTPGSSYSYYVIAFCPPAGCPGRESGESRPSNYVSVTVPPAPAPGPTP